MPSSCALWPKGDERQIHESLKATSARTRCRVQRMSAKERDTDLLLRASELFSVLVSACRYNCLQPDLGGAGRELDRGVEPAALRTLAEFYFRWVPPLGSASRRWHYSRQSG